MAAGRGAYREELANANAAGSTQAFLRDRYLGAVMRINSPPDNPGALITFPMLIIGPAALATVAQGGFMGSFSDLQGSLVPGDFEGLPSADCSPVFIASVGTRISSFFPI